MPINYRTPPLAYASLRAFSSVEAPKVSGWEQDFVVLTKTTQGTYEEVATCSTASEAWTARRTLATTDTSGRKFFVRSRLVQVVGPSSPEAGEPCCDVWRDAFRSGRDELVPPEQWAEYQKWVAGRISARQAYARVNRDQPRWN